MTEKAKRRRQTEDKDTVFLFGGKVWQPDCIESRAARTKDGPRTEDDPEGLYPKASMMCDSSIWYNTIEIMG
jgi:hypothetical protein